MSEMECSNCGKLKIGEMQAFCKNCGFSEGSDRWFAVEGAHKAG